MSHVKNNPFSLVFTELWAMLEDKKTFTDLVKIGNRIRFDKKEKRQMLKPNVAAGDLPEVMLSGEGLSANLFANSSATEVIRRYAWILSTGDLRINHILHEVEFIILAGMVGWQEKLGALKWNDKTFVKRAMVTDVTQGITVPEQNRGNKGWSSVWSIDVLMIFRTQDLKDLA